MANVAQQHEARASSTITKRKRKKKKGDVVVERRWRKSEIE